MPRLFVAVDIPPPVREELANLCHGVVGARWVDMSQIHLTLEFIGETDGTTAELLTDGLETIEAEPFPLALKGTGYFPPRGHARVLWAGATESPALLSLQRQVRAVARECGIAGDGRKFSPHITLARFRVPAPLHDIGPFIASHGLYRSDEFEVKEFHLYSSVLSRGGAVHTREQSYPLDTAGA